jgi:hypothetical protein
MNEQFTIKDENGFPYGTRGYRDFESAAEAAANADCDNVELQVVDNWNGGEVVARFFEGASLPVR